MALLFASTISEEYRESAAVINSIEVGKKEVRRKNIQELLTESFFHGASRFGSNFIA